MQFKHKSSLRRNLDSQSTLHWEAGRPDAQDAPPPAGFARGRARAHDELVWFSFGILRICPLVRGRRHAWGIFIICVCRGTVLRHHGETS